MVDSPRARSAAPRCPLLTAIRTRYGQRRFSQFDPERTLSSFNLSMRRYRLSACLHLLRQGTVMADERKIEMEGGCPCGTVRYRLTASPLFVHCCHCTRCQRETGSAFAVNALIEASAVELLQGQLRKTSAPSASGKGQVIFRCPDCGGAVWSSYGIVRTAILVIHVGTLDDPTTAPPDIHIFTSTKQPWVVLPAGVLAVSEYYHHSEYWPTESIERYKAARTS